jgi:hypothetical protein
MKRFVWTALFCFLAGCGPEVSDYQPSEEAILAGETGGDVQVASVKINDERICSGTLVGPRTVMTALHCFINEVLTFSYFVALDDAGEEILVRRVSEATVFAHSPVEVTFKDADGNTFTAMSTPGLVEAGFRFDYMYAEWCPDATINGPLSWTCHGSWEFYATGSDMALFLLDEPPAGGAIAPLSVGLTPLEVGDTVDLVGWGLELPGGSRDKRIGAGAVAGMRRWTNRWYFGPPNLCPGDSGGPALASGGLRRVRGVHSVADCSQLGADVVIEATHLKWLISGSDGDVKPWQNQSNPCDVRGGGELTCVQADREAIQAALAAGDIDLAEAEPEALPAVWVDVNGDNLVSAADLDAWDQGCVPLPPCQAGDANLDGSFDQFDIVQLASSAMYNTGQEATWSQGDFNGDGVFDQLDIVEAMVTGNYLSGPYATPPLDCPQAE